MWYAIGFGVPVDLGDVGLLQEFRWDPRTRSAVDEIKSYARGAAAEILESDDQVCCTEQARFKVFDFHKGANADYTYSRNWMYVLGRTRIVSHSVCTLSDFCISPKYCLRCVMFFNIDESFSDPFDLAQSWLEFEFEPGFVYQITANWTETINECYNQRPVPI